MFCIGLYARHTFRKIEPSMSEDVEMPFGVWQVDKSVQTEGEQMIHHMVSVTSEGARRGPCRLGGSNPSYSDSEDSLCKIEHAPLDGFPFPQARRQQRGRAELVEPKSGEEPGVDRTQITISADINYQDSTNVTVV